ncbi:unnamed protein product [Arctogadus glacialis]
MWIWSVRSDVAPGAHLLMAFREPSERTGGSPTGLNRWLSHRFEPASCLTERCWLRVGHLSVWEAEPALLRVLCRFIRDTLIRSESENVSKTEEEGRSSAPGATGGPPGPKCVQVSLSSFIIERHIMLMVLMIEKEASVA